MHKRGRGSCGEAVEEGETWVGQDQETSERRKNKLIKYEVLLGRNTKEIGDYWKYGGARWRNLRGLPYIMVHIVYNTMLYCN